MAGPGSRKAPLDEPELHRRVVAHVLAGGEELARLRPRSGPGGGGSAGGGGSSTCVRGREPPRAGPHHLAVGPAERGLEQLHAAARAHHPAEAVSGASGTGLRISNVTRPTWASSRGSQRSIARPSSAREARRAGRPGPRGPRVQLASAPNGRPRACRRRRGSRPAILSGSLRGRCRPSPSRRRARSGWRSARARARGPRRRGRARRGHRRLRVGPAHLPRPRVIEPGFTHRPRVRGHGDRRGRRRDRGGGGRPRARLLLLRLRQLLLLPPRRLPQVRRGPGLRARQDARLAPGRAGRAGARAARQPHAAPGARGHVGRRRPCSPAT